MSYKSSVENTIMAARELVHELKNPAPSAPSSRIGNKQMEALYRLTEISTQRIAQKKTANKQHETGQAIYLIQENITTRATKESRVRIQPHTVDPRVTQVSEEKEMHNM